MSKLVGISGYDAALPAAYQAGAPLGPPAVGGCGCAGGRGVGKVYTFTAQPGTNLPTAPMAFDIPLDTMANDMMQATRMERIATTVGLGFLIIGGLYLVGKL